MSTSSTDVCGCGHTREEHTAKTLGRNDACAYALDSDGPCFCAGFSQGRGYLLNPDGSLMTISIGNLTDEQEAVVKIFVAGCNVHDIGAGQLALAMKLIELGANSVTAIDKIYSYEVVHPLSRITPVGESFEEYAKHGHFIDVAFV